MRINALLCLNPDVLQTEMLSLAAVPQLHTKTLHAVPSVGD